MIIILIHDYVIYIAFLHRKCYKQVIQMVKLESSNFSYSNSGGGKNVTCEYVNNIT